MGYFDIMRDSGKGFEHYQLSDEFLKSELIKLDKLSNAELWEISTNYSINSPKGKAALLILKQREPESFYH